MFFSEIPVFLNRYKGFTPSHILNMWNVLLVLNRNFFSHFEQLKGFTPKFLSHFHNVLNVPLNEVYLQLAQLNWIAASSNKFLLHRLQLCGLTEMYFLFCSFKLHEIFTAYLRMIRCHFIRCCCLLIGGSDWYHIRSLQFEFSVSWV